MLLFLRIVLTPLALVAVAASAVFAWQFGWAKGATIEMKYAFAGLLCGLDISKAALPLMASWASSEGERGKARVIWGCFIFLTFASLWAANGVNAIQYAEREGHKASVEAELAGKRAVLDRLRTDRKDLPSFTFATAESVKTASDLVAAAEEAVTAAVKRKEEECGSGRGGRGQLCRMREGDEQTAREALSKAIANKNDVIANKAATDKATKLDAQIVEAERALASVDMGTVSKAADPQAASLAQALGVQVGTIALLSFVIASILVEIGSGLLPWMLYGHAGKRKEPEPDQKPEAETEASATTALEATFQAATTPDDDRSKFFRQCTYPSQTGRVLASQVYTAYRKWCAEQGLHPMTNTAFGRESPLPKEKAGGSIWYLGIELGREYVGTTQRLRVVASNG